MTVCQRKICSVRNDVFGQNKGKIVLIRRLLSETEHDWIYKKPLPVDFGQIAPDFRGDTLKSNYSIRISDLHFCRFWKNKVKGLTQQIRWRLTVEPYLPCFTFLFNLNTLLKTFWNINVNKIGNQNVKNFNQSGHGANVAPAEK